MDTRWVPNSMDALQEQKTGVASRREMASQAAAAGDEHRPRKAAKVVDTSWGLGLTHHRSPAVAAADSSPGPFSFTAYPGTSALSRLSTARAAPAVLLPAPKQEVDTPAAALQARPARWRHDAAAAAAEQPVPAAQQGSQSQDHILAERKRREKLSQRFIALSKLVPGLKKMDKASVLGDAIQYVKQLQDRVKGLEQDARRRPVEAAVLVRKSHVSAADDVGGVRSDENLVGSGDDAGTDQTTALLPDIEARVSERTVLVKIRGENRSGVLVAALSAVERMGLTIASINMVPFNDAMDITIVATAGDGFCFSVQEIVKRLNQAIKLSTS